MSHRAKRQSRNARGAAPFDLVENIEEREALLIFRLRPARAKAREAAEAEAVRLLGDLHGSAPGGGPLSEQGSLFWITLPAASLDPARLRLPRLGYTQAVDLLEPLGDQHARSFEAQPSRARVVSWHRRNHRLIRIYEENAQALRESSPDRRTFLLETHEGAVRPVRGYRGDGGPLSRRGLPVCDARLLVNLVRTTGTMFLDPFAGVGGIVLEAVASGYRAVSSDHDPSLRHGLANLGSSHAVADARRLPFAAATFDMIATEPPYDAQAESVVVDAFREMQRVLRAGGRLAVLCAAWQADSLRREAATLGLRPYLDSLINRKGLDVVALAWEKLDRALISPPQTQRGRRGPQRLELSMISAPL